MSQRQLARDMQTEFQARFSAKQARREAAKAQKADGEMRKQITNLIKKGDKASMAQAEQKAKVLLAKEAVAKQMDQAADMAELSVAQIQANNAMNRMTAMMMQSSKTMSKAQRQMNPERVCGVPSSYLSQCSVTSLSINLLTMPAPFRLSPPSSNSATKTKNTP